MKNEIVRKLTSLTLMTIMFAGGLTFAIPGVMPEASAAHNPNLFISAENPVSSNTVSGPMVVEIVVTDPNISRTGEAQGEPRITVNGQNVRMAQASTGSWYAYIADRAQALKADSINAGEGPGGQGLDFGTFCSAASAGRIVKGAADTQFFVSTKGIAFPTALKDGTVVLGTNGTLAAPAITADCATGFDTFGVDKNNVVRKFRTLNTGEPGGDGGAGQIGVNATAWPFIQLYDFVDKGNIVITYHTSPVQTTTLNFDSTMKGVSFSTDRQNYPQNAHVHLTVTDMQLNVDPTDNDVWTWAVNGTQLFYQLFNFDAKTDTTFVAQNNIIPRLGNLMFDDNGVLIINPQVSGAVDVLRFVNNTDSSANSDNLDTLAGNTGFFFTTLVETNPNTGIFRSSDTPNDSTIRLTADAARGTSGSISYDDSARSIIASLFFGTITMDASAVGNEWNSGEELPVILVDQDQNLNSLVEEDLLITDATRIWPSIRIGDPITLASLNTTDIGAGFLNAFDPGEPGDANDSTKSFDNQAVDLFSDVAKLTLADATDVHGTDALVFRLSTTVDELSQFLESGFREGSDVRQRGVFHYLHYDLRSFDTLDGSDISITIYNATHGGDVHIALITTNATLVPAAEFTRAETLTSLNGIVDITNDVDDAYDFGDVAAAILARAIQVNFTFTNVPADAEIEAGKNYTAVVDFFRFGMSGDGDNADDRFNDAIYRMELAEEGENTGTFTGSVEYIMLNQINVNTTATYLSITAIDDSVTIIAHEDLTEEDAVRVDYNDKGADGVVTAIAAQQDAPTHSGVVSFDFDGYKIADTVTVTVVDQDINVDSELIDIYSVITTAGDAARDMVALFGGEGAGYGSNTKGEPFAKLLNIEFDGNNWSDVGCGVFTGDRSLSAAGFTLIETGTATGTFKGDFQIPSRFCDGTSFVSTTGKDIGVNYVDFRDASGQIIEIGDSATIRANTGTVSLDRTVYPVPWGTFANYPEVTFPSSGEPGGRSIFPIHATGITGAIDAATEALQDGRTLVHIRINDPDFNLNPMGSDNIAEARAADNPDGGDHGPLKIMVVRGTDTALLATAGGPAAITGVITNSATIVNADGSTAITRTRELGPISEVAPDAGVFEVSLAVRFTDGPQSERCGTNPTRWTSTINNQLTDDQSNRFKTAATANTANGEFADNGKNCILQGDILTVEYLDPTDASGNPRTATDSATFDLRNGVLQSDKSVYIIGSDMILTLIEPDFDRDSKTAETYTLNLIEWDSDADTVVIGGSLADFDPEPSALRETGSSTGIFQVVVEIPSDLGGTKLNRGERIDLEYTDWGPSGARFVGQDDQDIKLTVFTSNFGATVELDQKVYTWTDKVYITIIAPDHNFDSNLVDDIGTDRDNRVIVQTRTARIDNYRLAETGTDTGIFTGEVILAGFQHDADGDGNDDITESAVQTGDGPTDGKLSARNTDGITIAFEFNEDETVVGSALVRWNIGEVSWLESSYPASSNGVVRIVDPDMNLNPEAIDNFRVNVWSDSDAGGISLVVTETNEATGIFEGTVFFTITDPSSGHRLRVSEGDTITAEYKDNTLPAPYTVADELEITGTSIIGTIVPPLERAPASNARVVDAFGNALTAVRVDQQVQIAADLSNGQDRDQKFAYLVQVQDASGVTVSLAWITGTLTAGQQFSPALSWIPDAPGSYTATVFVWESVDNPTALSPTVTTTINVS